ncbi:carbohydrate ABC transporter permease [Streptacidiphilus sp. P02-A3a]|uniref:carbohydrate ABC transporter permease n=1 Tax=Streptacidiphilus sp. P02-A3a TaxID=2704468 RepID=UPI0015FA641C|nr:carbohydrate ABC transporter permease [Streptacidiphilus sp. P02-A3a]QMU71690.1 carbohydrate ABC transporter permease [Streptacidiphilus sp. P02-A3a]
MSALNLDRTGSASPAGPRRNLRRRRRPRPGALLRDAVLLLAGVVFAVPVLFLVIAPTKTEDQIKNGSPFTIGNPANVLKAWHHVYAFDNGIILRWIANSLTYSTLSVLLMLVLCVTAGYGLAKYSFVGRKTILVSTLVAMIVPASATILPLYMEMAAVNLIGTLWSVVLPLAFYPWGVYLAYTYFAGGFPDSLMEAARIDGASEAGIFLRIALPLAKPLVALIAFFGFVTAWTNFMLPYLMLSDSRTYPLPLGLTVLPLADAVSGNPNFSTVRVGLPEVALVGVLSVLPILLMFLFAQRHLTSAQLAGSEKG